MAAVRDISDTSLYCSQPAFINTFRTIQEIVSIAFTTAEASLYSPRFYYFCVRQFMSTYFFRPVLASLLSLSIYLSIQDRMGCQEMDRERKGNIKKGNPWTALHRNGNIQDYYYTRLTVRLTHFLWKIIKNS